MSKTTKPASQNLQKQKADQQLLAENNRLRRQISANYQSQHTQEDPKRDRYLQELTWAEQNMRAMRYPVQGSNEKSALVDIPMRVDLTNLGDSYVALRADPLHMVETLFTTAASAANGQKIVMCDPTGLVLDNVTIAVPTLDTALDILRLDWATGSNMSNAGAPSEYSYAASDGSKFVLLQAGAIVTFNTVMNTALPAGHIANGIIVMDRFDGSEIEEGVYTSRASQAAAAATALNFVAISAISLGWYRFRLDIKITNVTTGAMASNSTITVTGTVSTTLQTAVVNYPAPSLVEHAAGMQAVRINYFGGVVKNVSKEIDKGGRVAVARFQGQPLDLFDFNTSLAYMKTAEASDSLNMTLTNGVFSFLPFGGPNTLEFVRYFSPPEDGAAFSDSQSPLVNARKSVIIAWQSPGVNQTLVLDLRIKLEFLTADPWYERAFATLDPGDITSFNAAMIDSQRLPIACENDRHASIFRDIRRSIREVRGVVKEGKKLYKEVVPRRARRVVEAILD